MHARQSKLGKTRQVLVSLVASWEDGWVDLSLSRSKSVCQPVILSTVCLFVRRECTSQANGVVVCSAWPSYGWLPGSSGDRSSPLFSFLSSLYVCLSVCQSALLASFPVCTVRCSVSQLSSIVRPLNTDNWREKEKTTTTNYTFPNA